MNKNIKIAKQLVKLAKSLMADTYNIKYLINKDQAEEIYYLIYNKKIKNNQLDDIIKYFLQKNDIDTINAFHLLFMQNNLNKHQHELIFDFFNKQEEKWKRVAFLDFVLDDLLTEKQKEIAMDFFNKTNNTWALERIESKLKSNN